MRINKIVSAVTVFGFVASSALAMEKLEKLTVKNPDTKVFFKQNDSLVYIDSAYSLVNEKYNTFFWTRWKVENALTENNFVFCDSSDRRKAIICGTRDKKNCKYVGEFFKIKEMSAGMPDIYDAEAYDRYGYDRNGNRRGEY